MKGKILKNGQLTIIRKINEKAMKCVNDTSGGTCGNCGDWCPAFREPMQVHYPKAHMALRLCENVGTLSFDELIDERK